MHRLESAILAVEVDFRQLPQMNGKGGQFLSRLLPASIAADFLENLDQVSTEIWVPRYGANHAKWLWWQQIIGMVLRYWAEKAVSFFWRLSSLILK
jgi:hypothetical protein